MTNTKTGNPNSRFLSYRVLPATELLTLLYYTQPFGSGATLAYNYIDLQIKNNTDQPYQLSVWLDDFQLYGCWRTAEKELYAYQVYEARHWITHEWWGGYLRYIIPSPINGDTLFRSTILQYR